MAFMTRDTGIDTLLELHNQVIDQGNGYWIKLEAWRVQVSLAIPHGIRYSLTLHEPSGKRVLGYDNAHAVKQSNPYIYAGKIRAEDHKHRHSDDKGIAYTFTDAYQLLSDFFADVDRVLKEVNPT